MSDPMTPEVRAWMKRTDVESPDAHESARRVRARLPGVRQRRRWWPFPVFYRKPESTTTENLTSIPASNGHTPTVIGRTTSMLSPVKAITAGALVFAIGGVMLIAQPFDQQGGVPGAETAEVVEPVEFTAMFIPSSSVRTGTYETVEGVIQQRGNAWTPSIRGASDPRMDGTLTYSEDTDRYPSPGHTFGSVTYRIVNDGGAWQGSAPVFMPKGAYEASSVVLLVGEGSYEGLYAWMDSSDWDAIQGVIFPAPPPEAPVPPELP